MPDSPEDLLKWWKEKHKLSDTIRSSTITCGLASVLGTNTQVKKACCRNHSDLTSVISHTSECVSKMKVVGSLFTSWQVHHRMQQNIDYPAIDSRHFTQVFACITGRNSAYKDEVALFQRETGCTDTLEVVGHSSQVMEHTKNEMVTVYKNCITLNFVKRVTMCIRWEIFDLMKNDESFHSLKERNVEVAKLVDRCVKCVTELDGIVDGYGTWTPDTLQLVNKIVLAYQDKLKCTLNDADKKVAARKERKLKTAIERKLIAVDGDKVAKKNKKAKRSPAIVESTLKNLPHLVLPFLYWAKNRIDQLPLTAEYEAIRMAAHEDKKAWTSWKWGKKVRLPMFKLLPICGTKVHYIRIDQRQLVQWGFEVSEDKWWLQSVFDVYSKAANIRPLRRYSDFNSPGTFRSLCDLAENGDKGPYIPGMSIQSDGRQAKISVLSLRHVTPNLDKLFERGYTGIPSNPPTLVDVSTVTRGIYRASACVLQDLEVDRDVLAGDPGQKKPLSVVKASTRELLADKEDAVCKAVTRETCILNDEYHERIGSKKYHEYELSRRRMNTKYKEALDALQKTRKKTCNMTEMTDYIRTRLSNEEELCLELHSHKRRWLKFGVFRKQHSAIAYYVKHFLKGSKNPIVFMGDGCFPAGGHGHAPVPKKKFIRQFSQFAVLILVNEYNTSQLCPRCHSKLSDIESENTTERLRMCATKVEGSPCFKADRDSIGAVNILQKGMFQICNMALSAFERGF